MLIMMKKYNIGSNDKKNMIDFAYKKSGVYCSKTKPKDPNDKKRMTMRSESEQKK